MKHSFDAQQWWHVKQRTLKIGTHRYFHMKKFKRILLASPLISKHRMAYNIQCDYAAHENFYIAAANGCHSLFSGVNVSKHSKSLDFLLSTCAVSKSGPFTLVSLRSHLSRRRYVTISLLGFERLVSIVRVLVRRRMHAHVWVLVRHRRVRPVWVLVGIVGVVGIGQLALKRVHHSTLGNARWNSNVTAP